MRMAFGLVGVLVTVGVIVAIMNHSELPYIQTVAKVNKTTTPQVEQIAGVGAADSIDLQEEMSGSKLIGVRVKSITIGGPMQKYFGLQPNDLVLKVNNMKIGELSLNDPAMARAQILESYQRQYPLQVLRQNQPLTLP